jgi:hypothetical protein
MLCKGMDNKVDLLLQEMRDEVLSGTTDLVFVRYL